MIDNRIEAKEIFLKDLFDSKFLFKIPEYQRQFSWETDNFDQLFEDIKQSFELKEDNYFLGSIILQIKDMKLDGSGLYDVVDGQQRLTTLTILLAVMRDLTNNKKAKSTIQDKIYQEENEFEGTKEEVRIEVRDRDKVFFRKYVLEEEGTKKSFDRKILSESQLRMVNAIELFRNKFVNNGILNQDLLNNMIKYLLNNCVLVYVKTGNFTSALRLFSILNDRGMALSTSDLLKSTNLGAINETKVKQYQGIWEQIEEDLGRDELDKLLGIIRTLLIKEKQRKSTIEEYNEIIFKKEIVKKGENFIEYLKEVTDLYQSKILDANLKIDNELQVKFHNLVSVMRDFIPSSDWIPVFLAFCLKYTAADSRYNFLKIVERRYLVSWMIGLTPEFWTVTLLISHLLSFLLFCSLALFCKKTILLDMEPLRA